MTDVMKRKVTETTQEYQKSVATAGAAARVANQKSTAKTAEATKAARAETKKKATTPPHIQKILDTAEADRTSAQKHTLKVYKQLTGG